MYITCHKQMVTLPIYLSIYLSKLSFSSEYHLMSSCAPPVETQIYCLRFRGGLVAGLGPHAWPSDSRPVSFPCHHNP